jgi:hypothetical protein
MRQESGLEQSQFSEGLFLRVAKGYLRPQNVRAKLLAGELQDKRRLVLADSRNWANRTSLLLARGTSRNARSLADGLKPDLAKKENSDLMGRPKYLPRSESRMICDTASARRRSLKIVDLKRTGSGSANRFLPCDHGGMKPSSNRTWARPDFGTGNRAWCNASVLTPRFSILHVNH